jgi:transcriptional regulator with XRE-family HTH domain
MAANVDLQAVGRRLRAARDRRGLTLAQLASLTGLTKAHLSRLESGERQASIGALVGLSSALGTKVSVLLGENIDKSPLTVYSPSTPTHHANGLEIASCSGFDDSQIIEAMRVTIRADRAPSPPVQHVGEEWLYVQRGSIDLEYDGTLYELAENDAVHFDAARPHHLMTRDVSAELLLVSAKNPGELTQIHH